MADASYQPYVYRKQGSTELVVASGGKINMESGATLTLTGQVITTTGALTANSITTTGAISGSSGAFTANVTLSSGINATTGTFTGNITGGANLTLTSGINATTGTFTGNVTGVNLTLTSGVNATTGTFTGNITGSGNLTLTSGINATTGTFTGNITGSANLTLTSGVNASTGTFTGAVSVSGALTRFLETATSSWSSIAAYGISVVKSTEDSEHTFTMAAPVAGVEKFIVCNSVLKSSGVSTGAAIVTSSGAGAAIGANTSILFTTGASNNQWIHLIGQNTTNWILVGQSTDVTLSAT